MDERHLDRPLLAAQHGGETRLIRCGGLRPAAVAATPGALLAGGGAARAGGGGIGVGEGARPEETAREREPTSCIGGGRGGGREGARDGAGTRKDKGENVGGEGGKGEGMGGEGGKGEGMGGEGGKGEGMGAREGARERAHGRGRPGLTWIVNEGSLADMRPSGAPPPPIASLRALDDTNALHSARRARRGLCVARRSPPKPSPPPPPSPRLLRHRSPRLLRHRSPRLLRRRSPRLLRHRPSDSKR